MEQEKRLRREIANSNERRRMQSINAGFQSLRGLLPHHEGEKLSKVRQLDFLTFLYNLVTCQLPPCHLPHDTRYSSAGLVSL
jgi:transcription factor AP-4